MRILSGIAALALLSPALALGQVSKSTHVNTFVFNLPFTTGITNPCNREFATIDGRTFFENTVTQDSSGGLHSTIHTFIDGQGTGEQGNDYVFVDPLGVFGVNNPSSGSSTFSIDTSFLIIGKGSVPDFRIHITIQMTLNPAGDLTASVLQIVADLCE